MASILLDTGVWLALCDPRDSAASQETLDDIQARIQVHTRIVPWPIAYETLRTRFVKNRIAMHRFEQEIKSASVVRLDDTPYREDALSLSIESSVRRGRPLSMVDCMLRLLMDDVGTRIRYLVTFNQGDFADVCKRRQIEVWPQ